MASPLQLETFSDIYTGIREALGIQPTDTNAISKIQRLVNLYYLDEVVPFKRWTWLQKKFQVVHAAYYNVGTAAVTPASQTVTLSVAPNVSLGSFTNYCFSIDNSNAIYTITSHTAGSSTVTLSIAFQEALNATANFKIWRDRVDLPTTAKETVEVTHPQLNVPMRAVGPQEFAKYQTSNPKREGVPGCYSTDTFFNPSGQLSESDRYRQVRVYPAIYQNPVTLTIEYIEQATPLVADTDEPIIPLEDRVVLYYGAGAQAWSIISRNEEMADKWLAKATAKLSRMAGERDDGFDTPKMTPDSTYVNSQRNAGLRRRRYGWGATGNSSVSLPTYLKNVTIDGGTLTNDLNVSPGVLIDGIDLSTLVGAQTPVSVTLLDNTIGGIAATYPIASFNVIHVDYSITRGTSDMEDGSMKLAALANGSLCASNQFGVVRIGSPGVTFTTDISNGAVRLKYTTTSTGSNANMQIRVFKWLG